MHRASWAPCHRGKPLHTTSMRRASLPATSIFMSATRTLRATRAPASRHTHGPMHVPKAAHGLGARPMWRRQRGGLRAHQGCGGSCRCAARVARGDASDGGGEHVVVGVDVSGRFGREAAQLLRLLAPACCGRPSARPPFMQSSTPGSRAGRACGRSPRSERMPLRCLNYPPAAELSDSIEPNLHEVLADARWQPRRMCSEPPAPALAVRAHPSAPCVRSCCSSRW